MINFISNTADVLNNLLSMLKDSYIIFAIVITIVGIVISAISGKIAKIVRGTKNISPNDNIKITLKIIGIVLILIGLIVVSISSITSLIK